ncbi:hypothetical protein QFC20_001316 [Naganishia adeliensis]|uniref:Uncharacterized protein n=1 Tax=Naganishia adeliensis TaxID=92952 RepID=A0ACC2WV46_9TREE|nr:hypothetical protein QFC20_001316 [Naganishia adeliensis]
MAACASSTRLISMELAFNPTIDFVGLYSNWGKAKTQARKRLSSLERYSYVPDLDFLHLLDDLTGFIRNQSTAAGFWSQYHPEEEMKAAGEYVRSAALHLLLEVTSSSDIARLLEKVDAAGLDDKSQRYLKFAQREARRSGAYLGESKREQYKAICDKLEHLKTKFVIVDEEPNIWVPPGLLDVIPSDYCETHKVDPAMGKVKISVKPSDYLTFVEYCDDDEAVKQLYELRENMMPENEQVLKSVLELRGQQAEMLGYPSFADYAMEVGMMTSPQAVRDFLEEANDRARADAEREKRYLVRTFDVFDTRPVDVQESCDSVNDQIHAPQLCGRLYLDLLARESKASNPCAIGLTSSTPYSPIIPAICLAASFGSKQHSCITFADVSNLLHELGHCVHFLLAQTSAYHRFNGFANEMDFIEVPSLLLEELLRLPEVVKMMAVDLDGNCIPEEYLGPLIAARDVNKAMNVRTQTLYSLISLDLHMDLNPTGKYTGETTTLVTALFSQYGNFPHLQTRMQHSFYHLIDYDCRYYTYIHSQMLVKALAERFLARGSDLPSVGIGV